VKCASTGLMMVTMALGASAMASDAPREQVIPIVIRIQRADYEGDRAALMRLNGELAPFVDDQELTSRVRYWRGFALWRRAMNGFNDKVDQAELRNDMQHALDEFNASTGKDAAFVDAKIGALSCLGFLVFSDPQHDLASPQAQELLSRARQLRKEIEAAAPENPRFLWVMGPMIWYAPAERGGGQDKAMAGYEKGLESIRKQGKAASDPLEPSWGEPELLMSLAWSNLNRSTPDFKAAKEDAEAALRLISYWHYVRDILLKQIREAEANQQRKLF